MSSKSIISKTFLKMKTTIPEKAVSFAQSSLKGSTTQKVIKTRVTHTSKELPTISRLTIEEEKYDYEGNDNDNDEGHKEDNKSLKGTKSSIKRKLKHKSSSTVNIKTGEIRFSKITLENTSDYFYSESNELFNPKEKVYIGLSYSANPAISIANFTYRDNDQNSLCKAISIDNFEGNNDEGLFCLFEGHGGSEVANYLQKNFRHAFHKAKQLTSDIDNAIKIAFYSIDKEMEEKDFTAGSTGNMVYIRKENNKSVIYSGNVGNTKTYLITFDEGKELSYEHNVNDAKENKRLVSSGGMILNDKLMGHFSLSRSFGDYQLKKFGVKCEPYVTRHVIEDKDMFIVIGSSGMWSLISRNDIHKLASSFNQSSDSVMKSLSHSPLIYNSTKGIGYFVLKLK